MSREYNDPLYTEFRKKVLARDGKICQWPGCNNYSKLVVHHIKKWATHQQLRYEPRNGICLCRKHHDLINKREEAYEELFFKIARNNELAPKHKKSLDTNTKSVKKKKRVSKESQFTKDYLLAKEKYVKYPKYRKKKR